MPIPNLRPRVLIDCSVEKRSLDNDEILEVLQHLEEDVAETEVILEQAQKRIDRNRATINWLWSLVDLGGSK